VREFLARNEVEHGFRDVRKDPIPGDEAIALVRRHQRGVAKKGSKVVELEISCASDEELRKLFLGREGTLRAPTLSDGVTVLSGFDEAALRKLTRAS
jgi:arsenate reductase-like glutaredoxin family protein